MSSTKTDDSGVKEIVATLEVKDKIVWLKIAHPETLNRSTLTKFNGFVEKAGARGVIITAPEDKIELLGDQDLERIGLKRIGR